MAGNSIFYTYMVKNQGRRTGTYVGGGGGDFVVDYCVPKKDLAITDKTGTLIQRELHLTPTSDPAPAKYYVQGVEYDTTKIVKG